LAKVEERHANHYRARAQQVAPTREDKAA
jgi:hypothetical protein